MSLDWSPDGKQLISGGEDVSVRVWAIRGHSQLLKEAVWPRNIQHDRAVAVLPAGNKSVEVYDFSEQEVLFSTKGKNTYWNPSGDKLVIRDGDRIRVLNGATGAEQNSFVIPQGHRLTAGWSGDGELLLSRNDSELRIWEAATGSEQAKLDAPGFEQATWSPCDQLLAILADREIEIWDAGRAVSLAKFRDEQLYRSFKNVNWSPDGKRIATAGWFGLVKIWEARSGRLLHELKGHAANHFIRSIAWNSDGTLVVSGGWDQSVKIWDTTNGHELRSLDAHNTSIESVAFNPNTSRLASLDGSKTLKLWDVATGEQLMTIQDGDVDIGTNLVWSRDGEVLWSCGNQGVTVFDAGRGYNMARTGELDANVAMLALSDGLQLAHSDKFQASNRAFEAAEQLVGPQAWTRPASSCRSTFSTRRSTDE
jgi:WD40 repeat protein